jgi:predicted CoA-binding protein
VTEPLTVAILGASADPDRYAFRAQRLLKQTGHRVLPVGARDGTIDGDAVYASLADIAEPVDTLSVYVRPAISTRAAASIRALAPRRVIFNPGTENPALRAELAAAGIECIDDCTLVMLRSGRF